MPKNKSKSVITFVQLNSMHTQILLVSENSIVNTTSLVACIISKPKYFRTFLYGTVISLLMYVLQETQGLCYKVDGRFIANPGIFKFLQCKPYENVFVTVNCEEK